ncbi:GntR family transcriptional regulator [Amycolatopsis saalfeldensis]|uniref:DNA-binding transcriptional regulator YhcF, GntR family n=1 Tax=Amycolatopsis saalfeldensis TaxID=394193 RepID=A0A1H8YA92_9PSEU|nr:GntR family transcriptional regulator [Amycolatopsis saalfeldensis]SEP49012.1 DNA-binding transcriptional regulator YhcF, GntR family [Amycolatopsis saalfeldensis]
MPAEPPYRRIVEEIRGRIRTGELRPGERIPSVRQIARHWGVAAATAAKAMTALREDGLVEATVGSGTVVSARRKPPATPPRAVGAKQPLSRKHVLRAAMAIADVEGLDAVSMRRLAAELGAAPMSLYRHVANKDELVTQMADEAFGEAELPTEGPDGWRAKLELIARRQWELCRRHLWLPRAVSLTRPMLVPNMMAHTEWTLRALDGLGLPIAVRTREALTLHGLVITVALAMAAEVESEQETGVTLDGWRLAQRERTGQLLDSGRFPLLAAVPPETAADLNGLFEYGLACHLDGFAALVCA